MSAVMGKVELTPAWFSQQFGLTEPNPFETALDELVEFQARKNRLLYERFGDIGLGQKDPPLEYFAVQHDGRNVCACAYGGSYPTWDARTASFWHNRSFIPWPNIDTLADIKRIKLPDWSKVPLVEEMLEKYELMKSLRRYSVPPEPELPWNLFSWTSPQGQHYSFTNFMSVLDLGCFICGETQFYTILAADETLADALIAKLFELSGSYTRYMLKAYGRGRPTALASFGGDNSCMLSPDFYRRYALRADLKLIDTYGDLPVNLHSCGPSSHLYQVWAEFPNRPNIVLMQTRGIPGKLHILRKALPDTHLQITIHQPQFDFEHESAPNIERVVTEYAQACQGRDLEIVAVVNLAGPKTDQNVRTFYRVMEHWKK